MNRTIVSLVGIEPSRIGGNEYWCRELSVQLGHRGWKNVLCFLRPPGKGVRQFLELPNVFIEVVENSWRIDARAAKDLWRILRRYRPQILHLHFTGFIGVYPWLAKLSGVERVFFTDQGSRPEEFVLQRAPLWKRLAARAINAPIDHVICVSDYGHRCLTATDLLPANRFRRIYNSIDFSRVDGIKADGAAFRRKYSIPEDRAIVVQVSWIIPEKGIPDLLEAARRVVGEFPRVQFVLVGEGAHRDTYVRQARQLGIEEYVIWTGLVEDPMAEGVFAAADVVCQMSRWEEVFGWTIAEAMGHSKPMVATRVGGIPELVEDGQSGFLVSRGDAAAMAEKILLLLRDPALRERMGRAGRLAAEAKFDLRKNVAEVLKLYGIV